MKYVVFLGDGMADYPFVGLGGKTPPSQLPHMNRVPQTGQRYKSSQGYQKFIQ